MRSTFFTLLVSFCLSAGSYILAQPDDVPVPVQHIEFDDYVIVSQVDPSDDGDGENIDMMNENWCDIWPDDVICQDEDQGGDDEEGC